MKKQIQPPRLKRLREKWNKDYGFKTLAGAWFSLCLTVIFATYHGYLGMGASSIWHGSICVYYLLLVSVRGMVLYTEHVTRTEDADTQRLRRQKAFSISSAVLLAMNIALVVPISLMVLMQKPTNLGLIPAIAMAAYTTYKITMAIVNMRRSRVYHPLIHELRTINLIDAFVSILTLQNTLIMVNGGDAGTNAMLPLSATSSAVIYAVIVGISVRMLRRGIQQIHI